MATITQYFVDLEKTSVAADTPIGATIVTVDDASFIDATDPLFIGAEAHAILSIDGNDITLTAATTIEYLIGVVVIIDDTLLDGLTPSSAKRTTIFIDGADVNNHSEVWIRRRNSGLEVTANTTGGDFINMIAWPNIGEYGYDDRPQSGIDAGWDMDHDEFFLYINGINIRHTGSNAAQVRYANMRIESSIADSNPAFYKKGGTLSFENCRILHQRTHQAYGPFVRLEYDGTSYIKLNDCYYRDNGACAIVGMHHTNDHNFNKQLHLTRCDVNASAGMYFHCTNDYIYQNNNTLLLDNTIAVFRGSGLYHAGFRAYLNGYNRILIYNNSRVRGTHLLKNTTTDVYYGMNPLKIDIHDSDVETTSIMFYFYHRNTHGSEANGYEKWSFKDSRIVANGHIVYFYRPDARIIRQYGDIEFKRCTIDCSTTLVHMQNLSNWGRLIFLDNKILNAGKILHSTTGPSYNSVINIKDAYINSHLMYGINSADIDLSNVVINGLIAENAVAHENVTANNIVCKGTAGHGSYKIENSKIDTITQGDPFPSSKSVVLRGCDITSANGRIADGTAGQVTFIECNVSGILTHDGGSWRTVFDSVVNGETIPYFNSDMDSRKEISPVFRIGGSDGAIKISSTLASPTGFLSHKNIIGELSAGATSVAIFFATTASEELISKKASFSFRYTNTEGDTVLASAGIEVDTNSNWDGLAEGVNRYKASADIVNVPNFIGDNKTVVLEMIFTPDIDDVDTEMYLDMNMKSE